MHLEWFYQQERTGRAGSETTAGQETVELGKKPLREAQHIPRNSLRCGGGMAEFVQGSESARELHCELRRTKEEWYQNEQESKLQMEEMKPRAEGFGTIWSWSLVVFCGI